LLASSATRCVRHDLSRTSSLLQSLWRFPDLPNPCRSQLVGEFGYAVCQALPLANKFAPTELRDFVLPRGAARLSSVRALIAITDPL